MSLVSVASVVQTQPHQFARAYAASWCRSRAARPLKDAMRASGGALAAAAAGIAGALRRGEGLMRARDVADSRGAGGADDHVAWKPRENGDAERAAASRAATCCASSYQDTRADGLAP